MHTLRVSIRNFHLSRKPFICMHITSDNGRWTLSVWMARTARIMAIYDYITLSNLES